MKSGKYDVCVIGLGYVGLTLATVLAEVGLKVIGIEKRREIVELTSKGIPHFSENGLPEALSRVVGTGHLVAREFLHNEDNCPNFIITVGTPLDSYGMARLDMIKAAATQVAENMTDGALVILRSTVKIGTARNIVSPILATSGKKFDIAMCPERTLEGKALQELRELPQIIGADSIDTANRASNLFKRITNSTILVSSLEASEIIKLVDNTYRDVQFAFANEVARMCELFSVNAHEIIAAGKLGYSRTCVPLPGLVGGPCLEKDPHILSQSTKELGLEMEITQAARLVNERQPAETVNFIIKELNKRKIPGNSKVVILGLAFKGIPATDDLRGSMSIKVLEALLPFIPPTSITLFDPVIGYESLTTSIPGYTYAPTLKDAISGASIVIITNNHPALGAIPPRGLLQHMAKGGFVYDYWNHFSNLNNSELMGSYFAVGNTNRGKNE